MSQASKWSDNLYRQLKTKHRFSRETTAGLHKVRSTGKNPSTYEVARDARVSVGDEIHDGAHILLAKEAFDVLQREEAAFRLIDEPRCLSASLRHGRQITPTWVGPRLRCVIIIFLSQEEVKAIFVGSSHVFSWCEHLWWRKILRRFRFCMLPLFCIFYLQCRTTCKRHNSTCTFDAWGHRLSCAATEYYMYNVFLFHYLLSLQSIKRSALHVFSVRRSVRISSKGVYLRRLFYIENVVLLLLHFWFSITESV